MCMIWRSSLCQPHLGEDAICFLNLLLISIQGVLSMFSISLLVTTCTHQHGRSQDITITCSSQAAELAVLHCRLPVSGLLQTHKCPVR